MAELVLPSPHDLRQLFSYNPETGSLVWLRSTSRRVRVGDKAGSRRNSGEWLAVGLCGRKVPVHRVIWAIQTGEWPSSLIDHVDGNGANNTWSNLRLATRGENQQNRAVGRNNTSGFTGVFWDDDRQRWLSMIKVGGKVHRLGRFESKQDAAGAYAAAKKRLHDFHPEVVTRRVGV